MVKSDQGVVMDIECRDCYFIVIRLTTRSEVPATKAKLLRDEIIPYGETQYIYTDLPTISE